MQGKIDNLNVLHIIFKKDISVGLHSMHRFINVSEHNASQKIKIYHILSRNLQYEFEYPIIFIFTCLKYLYPLIIANSSKLGEIQQAKDYTFDSLNEKDTIHCLTNHISSTSKPCITVRGNGHILYLEAAFYNPFGQIFHVLSLCPKKQLRMK